MSVAAPSRFTEATTDILLQLRRLKPKVDWPGCGPHQPKYVEGCEACTKFSGVLGYTPATRTQIIAALRELELALAKAEGRP